MRVRGGGTEGAGCVENSVENREKSFVEIVERKFGNSGDRKA